MGKKQGILIMVVCFVVLLVGAGLMYDGLADKAADELVVQNETAQPTEEQEGTQEKMPAPDFTVYDADGNAVKLSDFVGKPVVLNFWASWCGPCKSEMPDFNEVWKEYEGEVQFMMVNLTDGFQETKERAQSYVEEQGFEFPVFYDTEQDAAYTYGVQAVPVSYFVNADGTGAVYVQGAIDRETLIKCIEIVMPAK